MNHYKPVKDCPHCEGTMTLEPVRFKPLRRTIKTEQYFCNNCTLSLMPTLKDIDNEEKSNYTPVATTRDSMEHGFIYAVCDKHGDYRLPLDVKPVDCPVCQHETMLHKV